MRKHGLLAGWMGDNGRVHTRNCYGGGGGNEEKRGEKEGKRRKRKKHQEIRKTTREKKINKKKVKRRPGLQDERAVLLYCSPTLRRLVAGEPW